MAEKENLQDVIAQNERQARAALERGFGQSPAQLQLFEAFCEEKASRKKNHKNEHGYTLAEEAYARFRACGHNRTESWKLAHPQSAASDATAWSKASRLDKEDKIQARILFWQEKMAAECLMSTTELFALLTKTARGEGKDAIRAQELIGKIHGVFQAEKGLPGSQGNPLVVQCVDFVAACPPAADAQGARKREEKA